MDRAGVKNACELALFTKQNKKPLSQEGLARFNQLANNPFFSSTDPLIRDALKGIRNENEIQRMLAYIQNPEANRKLIPKGVRRSNKYWRDIYDKKLPKVGAK